jgi:hypothetical protein
MSDIEVNTQESIDTTISENGTLNENNEFIPREMNPDLLLDLENEITASVQTSVRTSVNVSNINSSSSFTHHSDFVSPFVEAARICARKTCTASRKKKSQKTF